MSFCTLCNRNTFAECSGCQDRQTGKLQVEIDELRVAVRDAEARGRAAERADAVAYALSTSHEFADQLAAAFKRGAHEGMAQRSKVVKADDSEARKLQAEIDELLAKMRSAPNEDRARADEKRLLEDAHREMAISSSAFVCHRVPGLLSELQTLRAKLATFDTLWETSRKQTVFAMERAEAAETRAERWEREHGYATRELEHAKKKLAETTSWLTADDVKLRARVEKAEATVREVAKTLIDGVSQVADAITGTLPMALEGPEHEALQEVDIDGYVDEKGVRYVGKAARQPDGTWISLADVGGCLCRVLVKITPKEPR